MNTPGYFSLGSFSITAADSYVPPRGQHVDGLAGMLACSVELIFLYGSGGTSGKVFLQTSLDQADEDGIAGGTWIDIACMAFTTASKVRIFNFSGLTAKTTPATPTDGALPDDTALDGILGDRLRLRTDTIGVYAGTAIQGRLVAR